MRVKLTIHRKMMNGFGVIILVMIAANAYILFQLHRVATTTTQAMTLDVQSIDLAKQLHTILFEEERHAQKYLISRDTVYRSLFLETNRLFRQYLDSLDDLSTAPEDRRAILHDRRIHAWHAEGIVDEEDIDDRTRTDSLDAIHHSLDELITRKQRVITDAMTDVELTATRSLRLALILTGGTFLASIIMAFFIARTITRPINTLVQGTERVARGSFEPIQVTSTDEMATLAEAFNRMSDTLNKINTYKVEMMQQITHELRTPLQTIHAAHYILTESKHGPLTDDQRRLLATIRENVEKIANFSNQFLDLSRIEAGVMDYKPVRTDLNTMVKAVVDDARISAERKNIVLFFSSEPAQPVMLDTERGLLVFTNLMSNALKYTDEGGTIHVAVAPYNGGVRVAVKDSGVGIPRDELPKVFTKFYRASTAVRGKSKGTGLGLALVKAIVEGHGGRVSVASAPGAGSTFTVDLPVAPSQGKGA